MKLNRKTLKQIIKEELNIVLDEARIRPINPLDNIPDGKNKDKIQKLIDQGGDFTNQGYEFAYAMQDPSMGSPYEGTDYPGEKTEYDAAAAIGKASKYIGKYVEALVPSSNNSSALHKHIEKIFKGTVEVGYDKGRGPISMSVNLYFDGEDPISLRRLASNLGFAYIDLHSMNYLENAEKVMSNIQIGLKKMIISEAEKLIFRSREAAHYFGVKAKPPHNKLGGSGVFAREDIWYDYGKFSPPNEKEIAEKLKNGTIVINN